MDEHKFFNQRIVLALVFLVLLGGVFWAGVKSAPRFAKPIDQVTTLANKELNQPATIDFTPFWKAWTILNEKYVAAGTSTAVTDQEKVWGAISGLATSLGDPYTVFFPPVEAKEFEDEINGNFEGVGMEIGIEESILTVIAPLKDTPAYRAGIKAGDQIIKIGERGTASITIEEAIKLIRGERGTPVDFTILRDGEDEPLEITVVRDVINIPTIDTALIPEGIFVVELYNFSAVSPDSFRLALREFIESGSDKLLLDLRGNPGGYLEAAIDIASWFLPTGKVVVKEDFGEFREEIIYRSKGYDIFNNNLKMVVLVDRGSASASEILAGALKEHGIATIIGTRTFGKGSVQELVDITDETSLKVTIAHWLTPNGTSISDGGLAPDIEVTPTPEEIEARNDVQRKKAIEILLNM